MAKEDEHGVAGIFSLIVLLYCSAWLITKDIVLQMTPIWASTVRMAVSFVTLSAIVLLRPGHRIPLRVLKTQSGDILILSFLGFGFYFVLTFLSLKALHPSELMVILALIPAITYLFGLIWFGEKRETRKIAGLLMATVAAVLFSLSRTGYHFSGTMTGVIWALLAAVSYALYGLVLKLKMAEMPMIGLMSLLTGIASVLMLALAFWAEPLPATVSWRVIWELVLVGVTMSAPTYFLYGRLVVKGGPVLASMIGIIAPFLTLFVERLLGMRDHILWQDIGLMAICLYGIVIIQTRHLQRSS